MRPLLLAIVVLGAGCVAKKDTLGRDQGKSAGDALGNGIEDSAASFGPVNAGATVDAQCATASGNTADPDADSIPTNATITFNCSAMALGYTGTLTGTEMVVDDQPAVAAWAFSATANLHAALTGPFGGTITRDWDGQIVAAQATALGPFTLARTLDAVTVFTSGNGPAASSTTVTENNDWIVTYTPTITWTPGTIAVTGSLTATGAWNLDVDGTLANATLSTPTPLTLTPTCATRVTAGAVTGTWDSGAHSITVTWTACGVRTVTSV